MRPTLLLLIAIFSTTLLSCSQILTTSRSKKIQYEQINFEDLMRRYMDKDVVRVNDLEGIYSVSCVVVRRGRNIFGNEQEKVVERKDNYARIAILKDRPSSKHDYIEVSLSYREPGKYPIMGMFNVLSEGRGLIYEHLEPNGSTLPFSMKNEIDLIEGEYALMEGRKTIIYKLSYLRIYPKTSDITVNNH